MKDNFTIMDFLESYPDDVLAKITLNDYINHINECSQRAKDSIEEYREEFTEDTFKTLKQWGMDLIAENDKLVEGLESLRETFGNWTFKEIKDDIKKGIDDV